MTSTNIANYVTEALRGYIQSEWCGADHASLSAMRGEITAALLAADPSLSNTAASFRFHSLLAEMRDNDSIADSLLATMEPAPADAADALKEEAAHDLNIWLDAPGDLPPYAIRAALRILADPIRGGKRPELAAAMLAELDRRFPPQYVTIEQPSRGIVWQLTDRDGQPVEAGTYTSTVGEFAIEQHPDARVNLEDGEPTLVPITYGERAGRAYVDELVDGWAWTPEFGPRPADH